MRQLNDNIDLKDLKKVVFEKIGFTIYIEVIYIKKITDINGKNYYLVVGINALNNEEKLYFYTSSILTTIFEKEDLLNDIISIEYKGEQRSKTSKNFYKMFEVMELEPNEMAKIISEIKA